MIEIGVVEATVDLEARVWKMLMLMLVLMKETWNSEG